MVVASYSHGLRKQWTRNDLIRGYATGDWSPRRPKRRRIHGERDLNEATITRLAQRQTRTRAPLCSSRRRPADTMITKRALSTVEVSWKSYSDNSYISPPSVSNSGTKCACSLERTLMNFWKSATLLRVRNSSSLWLRSRGCTMFVRCSLCGHVIQPTAASSLTNVTSATIQSSSWLPLIVSVRIRTSSKGRTSPYSAPISAVQITQ